MFLISNLVGGAGFEPAASVLSGLCYIHMSFPPKLKTGLGGGIRTHVLFLPREARKAKLLYA